MTPMRVGVNALYLIPGRVGGTEIYLRALLTALGEIDSENEYIVFTNRETGGDLVPQRANFLQAPQRVRAAIRPARIAWEQVVLPVEAARRRLNVLLNPGFTAPLLCGVPQVTVFHDLQHLRHPENFRWFDLPFWKVLLYWSAQVSRLVVADSAATAEDLRRFYRLPAGKIVTAPLGVDPVFFEIGKRRRPEPFLLAVSTLHPHKNLDGLLRAFAEFRRKRPEFKLVVCGLHGFFTEELQGLRASLGLEEWVEFPGWIAREQVHELYARAWGFVYPSRFEGFGLPVLEAMAAGVPAACSRIEPIIGIAGGAALHFDPESTAEMAGALERITGDTSLRERLAEAGPRRACEFSWRKTAELTLEALRRAAGSEKKRRADL
jgi:glycosyltransferase involved in cell wall biosynthesis